MNIREKICAGLFEWSYKPYAILFKRNKVAWGITIDDLQYYPDDSIGLALGNFLKHNGFNLLDKLESHDVFHVITGMSCKVKDEVGMQYWLFGNGKRSLYMFSTMFLSTLLLPEYFRHFIRSYRAGKMYHPIYNDITPALLKVNLTHHQQKLKK